MEGFSCVVLVCREITNPHNSIALLAGIAYNIIKVVIMLNQFREATVKYTAVLPQEYLDELRKMSENKMISSVNQAIRAAIGDFVAAHKKQEYLRAMQKAAKDKSFIERTMDSQQAFAALDAEVMEMYNMRKTAVI